MASLADELAIAPSQELLIEGKHAAAAADTESEKSALAGKSKTNLLNSASDLQLSLIDADGDVDKLEENALRRQ